MTNMMTKLKTAAAKRAQFNRTYNELRSMSRTVAWDLGMFPEDAYEVAYRHVYGR
ncbi:hypothetical protein KX928_07045 [Roseobacter sp. YSTF-M11]|uniref:Uncharacterized protein n=1 Tax=Roseobacter insulae TaxID=2859783 RepID=A0A9X1FTT5_9RHOB|nr:hypothetical protein [Roseobacter insulae]MBW4707538.1 hypothetical protein [Roseobacter insulae]